MPLPVPFKIPAPRSPRPRKQSCSSQFGWRSRKCRHHRRCTIVLLPMHTASAFQTPPATVKGTRRSMFRLPLAQEVEHCFVEPGKVFHVRDVRCTSSGRARSLRTPRQPRNTAGRCKLGQYRSEARRACRGASVQLGQWAMAARGRRGRTSRSCHGAPTLGTARGTLPAALRSAVAALNCLCGQRLHVPGTF